MLWLVVPAAALLGVAVIGGSGFLLGRATKDDELKGCVELLSEKGIEPEVAIKLCAAAQDRFTADDFLKSAGLLCIGYFAYKTLVKRRNKNA